MPKITDLLRKSLHNRLNLTDDGNGKIDQVEMWAEVLGKVKALDSMVKMAKDRLVMGSIRHGVSGATSHDEWMDKITAKLRQFDKTGNAEMLIDIMNYAAIAMTYKAHPTFYFDAEDRKD